MRSHGTAVACYRGYRPKTGTCVRCRIGNAIRNRTANDRYRGTVLGMLSEIRHRAKVRKG